MNGCPSSFDACSPTMRASTSALPPAANGTITLIGLEGYLSCAQTIDGHARTKSSAPSNDGTLIFVGMTSLPGEERLTSTALGLSPGGKFDSGLLLGRGIEAKDRPALLDLFRDKVLEGGHLHSLVRDFL